MIFGNIDGVKDSVLKKLDIIYDVKVPKYLICTEDIIDLISSISVEIDREISVGIDRKGKVISVSIGDSTSVEMPIIDIKEKKLSGIRIIHTHPNGVSRLSALDISALLKLKLDALVAIGVKDTGIIDFTLGFCYVENENLIWEEKKNLSLDNLLSVNFIENIEHIESIIKTSNIKDDDSEKAIIVGCDSEESLKELEELASACNIPVLEMVFQSRPKIDPAFFIGSGKVEEIATLRQMLKANLIIFDDELSGSQVRNLEQYLGVKVIDRTTLILEIFARRAKTKEAKIQVELAQLKYRSSRLTGLGTVLSRTGGGIGTRGPGEKKLEIDRRHIKERIYDLTTELKKIKKVREVQREKRGKQNLPQISLVGYTNAGKSTLRNILCEKVADKDNKGKESVFEANMLFATLETTTRSINLLNNRPVTLTDTVGFVRKLPHELVEAFKSTLEEVIYSDLLCHVVDSSSPYVNEQIKAVEDVLEELSARDKCTLLLLNKCDLTNEDVLNDLFEKYKDSYKIVKLSAKSEINLDGVLQAIEEELPDRLKTIEFLIPYTSQQVVSYLHRNANILIEDYKDNGTYVKADVDDEIYNKCKEFEIVE